MTTPDTPKELKPCPWCGEVPFWPEGTPGVWRMHCRAFCRTPNCRGNAQGKSFPTEDEAIEDWNRRTPDARITSAERERDELKRERDLLKALHASSEQMLDTACGDAVADISRVEAERDELRAKVAELEVDKARLDFLDAMVAGPEPLRDGIDAARAKQAQERK